MKKSLKPLKRSVSAEYLYWDSLACRRKMKKDATRVVRTLQKAELRREIATY